MVGVRLTRGSLDGTVLCMHLRPFRALRPAPEHVARVAAPPYDVVGRAEAAALSAAEPLSILHVTRPDADFPVDVAPHDRLVYAAARAALDRLVATGALLDDHEPALYVYREATPGRAQVGVVGCVSVGEYEAGVIKQHETTRPDKEADRARHIEAADAHAEPVLLAYRGRAEVDRLVAAAVTTTPLYDFAMADAVRHTVWRVGEPDALVEAFGRVPAAYVADGHHRSASALRVAQARRRLGKGEHEWFPAALVPAEQLQILPYNRLVTDLAGRTPDAVRAELGRAGRMTPATGSTPPGPGRFAIYLGGRWELLELPPGPAGDPVRSLDVWLLETRVLRPVLGIDDQRTDPRIDFVGGPDGAATLAARVDAGEAALAIALHPTSMVQIMAVADAGAVMPPKSTWFEPKLASGLFVHRLD
jgi:uncharacterized protein (DUF1015 family)